jgi:hypothetical protein
MRHDFIDDMIAYGYLLPNFTPLMTRYVCKRKVLRALTLQDYRPDPTALVSCFGKKITERVIIRRDGRDPVLKLY